jgi:hypothetical protein
MGFISYQLDRVSEYLSNLARNIKIRDISQTFEHSLDKWKETGNTDSFSPSEIKEFYHAKSQITLLPRNDTHLSVDKILKKSLRKQKQLYFAFKEYL